MVSLLVVASVHCYRGCKSLRHTLRMGTGNSFGKVFRISTFGESHGGGVGVIVDGCPPKNAL